jgi:hypothetical protein
MQKVIIPLSVLVILSGVAMGQVPELINYQGILMDPATGDPVANNIYEMVFSIYDVATGGSAIWTETKNVQTQDGLYSVLLGSTTPVTPTIFSGAEKYLGIKVGADPEMTPRKKIVSVAYAIVSKEVSGSSNIFPSDGNVGIGTTSPGAKLHIMGSGTQLQLDADAAVNMVLNRSSTSFVNRLVFSTAGINDWQMGQLVSPSDFSIKRITTPPDVGNNILHINESGNVGIWTTSPQSALEVAGLIHSTYGGFKFPDGTVQTSAAAGSGGGWTDDGTNVYLTTSTDNVGIGDTSPTNKLDVAGKIGINDTQLIYLPDQTDFAGTLYLGDGGGSLSHTASSTGYYNTAMGIGALYANTTGFYNTASGNQALYSNIEGYLNTASGYGALYSNTGGTDNTASGAFALYLNKTGFSNTASGYGALRSNNTGCYNTASGNQVLQANSTGMANTASGYRALYYNTTGTGNTAIGESALLSNATGTANTAIGSSANVGSGDLENATAIGYAALVNASNKVVIGNTDVTVIGGYANWSNLSDSRFKHAVREDIKGLDFIARLRPVTFKLDIPALNAHLGVDRRMEEVGIEYVSTSNKGDIVYSGFIGQDVEAAAREVGYDFSGVVPPQNDKDHYSLKYAEFVVPLVKAVQEQQEMIEKLQERVRELENR